MKITVGQLRRIIKEEIQRVNEAPLADVGDFVNTTSRSDDSRDVRAAERFHKTPKYRKDAEATFKLFDIPVYIVPIFTSGGTTFNRVKVVPWEEAEPLIKESGLKTENIESELGKGACVILSRSGEMVRNFMPSPWMLLHAMFDDSGSYLHKNVTIEIQRKISDLQKRGRNMGLSVDDVGYGLLSTLSMRSAREGNLNVDTLVDWAAEIATQAVRNEMTTRRYTFSRPKLPDELKNSLVRSLKKSGEYIDENDPKAEIINGLAQELRDFVNGLNIRLTLQNYIRGKVIEVNVSDIFDD